MAEGDIFAAPHFQNDDDARKMLESILWPPEAATVASLMRNDMTRNG